MACLGLFISFCFSQLSVKLRSRKNEDEFSLLIILMTTGNEGMCVENSSVRRLLRQYNLQAFGIKSRQPLWGTSSVHLRKLEL